MDFNRAIVETTSAVLQGTIEGLTENMILETLYKKGRVTIEEATFFKNLVSDVITEAAEDFIPDEVDIPDENSAVSNDEDIPNEGDIYYDDEGNTYQYTNGELVPVVIEGAGEEARAGTVEGAEEASAGAEAAVEESENIVAKILANIK